MEGAADSEDAAADAFDGWGLGVVGECVGVVLVVVLVGDGVEEDALAVGIHYHTHSGTGMNDDMLLANHVVEDALPNFGRELKDSRVLPVGIGDLLIYVVFTAV